MKKNLKPILVLVLTLFTVMLGFGMVIPILPFYVLEFNIPEANSGVIVGGLMASYAVMQLIFSPIWGSVSDRTGRRIILAIGIFGNGIAMLMMGLSSNIYMLFGARMMAGLLSSATMPTAMAYIGDVTSDEDRGSGMGIMGAAMGAGMIFGPGLGGWFSKGGNLSMPFFISFGMSMLAFLLILLFLPESLKPDARDKHKKISGLDFKKLFSALGTPIGIYLVMAFLLSFGMTNFESVFALVGDEKFKLGAAEVANILVVIAILSTISQGFLTGYLAKKFGEKQVIKGALLLAAIGFFWMAISQSVGMLIVASSFFSLTNSLLRPSVSSITSRIAEIGQGTAMGFNNAYMSLGRIIGPVWAGFIFDHHVDFPFISGGVVMLIGFIVSLIFIQGGKVVVEAKVMAD